MGEVMRRGDLKYLILEGFVVLFGVLLALLVDGVRQTAAERTAAEAAVQRVHVEVARNLDELLDLTVVVEQRLGQLRALHTDAPQGAALSDLIGRFRGYRTPDLSEAAWRRLSGSDLSDLVDPALTTDAFYLYEWNRQYQNLNLEINRLIYSEVFYDPMRLSTAIRISERIMEQQLSWARDVIPLHEAFLSRDDQR
jgi:hypothetical protein